MDSILEGLCNAYGASYNFTIERMYPTLKNDSNLFTSTKLSLVNLVGKDKVILMILKKRKINFPLFTFRYRNFRIDFPELKFTTSLSIKESLPLIITYFIPFGGNVVFSKVA